MTSLAYYSWINSSLNSIRFNKSTFISQLGRSPFKEVIQPHLPVRLPCYDFTPVISPALGALLLRKGWSNNFGRGQLPWCDGRCVQGPGTYSPQYADLRLLAIPPSCRRVAACNLNCATVYEICSPSRGGCPLSVAL
jgi:hypothetical protein